jgi:serine/threonine kinase 32
VMGSAASSYAPSPTATTPLQSTPPPKSFRLPPTRTTRSLTSPSSFFSSTPKLSHYFIGSIIGQGGFGKIREIKKKKDDRWFALKIFEFKTMTLREAQAIVTELLGLSRIPSHPFVIQLHAAFRERSTISFVMDLLVGGDLRILLRSGEKFDETKIAYIIACIGSALHHIHIHQVIHRDIKPENIMFTSRGFPKLIDFGIAHLSSPSSSVCVCQSRSGTTQYMSPEALVPQTHCHGFESDFWSLGIVMYEMVFSTRPYETRVSPHLIQYSGETYEFAWKSLLDVMASEVGKNITDSVAVGFANTTGTVPNFADQTVAPSDSSVGWKKFFPITEEDDSSDLLSQDLLVCLPEFSPTLDASPSENCRSLLSSLLDVRIQRRCGVGENYSSFAHHAFFVSQNTDVDQVLSMPSPIHLDREKIGMQLWNQFFSTNLEDELSSSKPLKSSPPSKEVDDYFKEIQATTPLLYESNDDAASRRDAKFVGNNEWNF